MEVTICGLHLFVLDLSFIGWSMLSALTMGLLNIWLTPYNIFSGTGTAVMQPGLSLAASLALLL